MKQENSPEEVLEKKCADLGLVKGRDMVLRYESDGSSIIIVTRSGYRKVVSGLPDYETHQVYPLYDNSKIRALNNEVEVFVDGGYANLVGAIGYLWKIGGARPWVYQADIEDYASNESAYWEKMPCTMIQKACEMALFRTAYPELFSNIYSEDEILDTSGVKMKEMLRYVRKNIDTARVFMSNETPVESLSALELGALYEKTKSAVEEAARNEGKN